MLGTLFPLEPAADPGWGLYMAITDWGFALAWLDAALVDQGLFQHHKQAVGATPTFYRLANQHSTLHPFFDVTQGNNLYYPATAGYDLASGWGTPNLGDFGKVLGAF